MKLSFNQIKEISTGCARVEEENGFVNFYRFTKEQEELAFSSEEEMKNAIASWTDFAVAWK